MEIQSTFTHLQEIPEPYTCLGSNINPPLEFRDVPPEAESMVLIFEDLDAEPQVWTHWLVFNIPPSTLSVPEGELPSGGTEGLANNHTFGYEGPCPRYFNGAHRYRFTLYALNTSLAFPATTERKEIQAAIKGKVLEKAELLGIREDHKSQA